VWVWIPVILAEMVEEYCNECDKELTLNSRAYVKAWWPPESEPEFRSLICEECMRRK